jgi:hypothetical protein
MKSTYLLACLALIATASATYTPTQQAMYDGTRLSWKMAVAYTNQDTSAYNALVDQWNAWVYQNFGQDPALIAAKLTGPVDLQKPYVSANNTTTGIVHSIDGSMNLSSKYTTNDVNLLPQSVANQWRRENPGMGDGYLGGV